MKRVLLIGITIIVATACFFAIRKIHLSQLTESRTEKLTWNPTDITLNGIPADAADGMVTDFTDDNTSTDKWTTIWLSKPWVDAMSALLDKEQSDAGSNSYGFRFYFAKKANGKNTIIIVSTGDGQEDYFEHTSAFLDDLKANPSHIALYIKENYNGNGNAGDPGERFYDDSFNCSGISTPCIFTIGNNIDCEVAHGAVKYFRDHPDHPGNSQKISTTSEWFPLSLLDGLEEELQTPATSTVKPDGVRIYFARDQTTHRHFFILVPTQANLQINGSHIDNYDCFGNNSAIKKNAIVNHNDIRPNYISPNDNGELCPTHCQGATLP
jgi:hypothetical protein